jgi:uncharacterized protein YqeY
VGTSIQARVAEDMKAALKGGDKDRLQALRSIMAQLKQVAIDAKKDDLTPEEELGVLMKASKTRKEAIAQARAVGREDVAVREQAELLVIEGYMPKQLAPAELAAKVKELAAAIGYAGAKDRGRFMKEWMARYKGVADGKDVQAALDGLG